MITINNNGLSIEYISSGLFLTKERWVHPTRKIDSYEVIYVVEGDLFIQEGTVQYSLTKGDILLLHPDRIHMGYDYSSSEVSFYWGHFTVSDFSKLEIDAQYFKSLDNYKFTGLFKQLLHLANTRYYPKYSLDLMIALILNEISVLEKEENTKNNKLIKDVAEWVRINSDKKITVESVADYFGYNPDYLSCRFKQSFEISLKQYINAEKIKQAKSLLLASNYSIKQISDILAFNNENSFINFFKYHESISPTKYKNMYYNTHFNNK